MPRSYVKAANSPDIYRRLGGGQLEYVPAATPDMVPDNIDTVGSLSDEDRRSAQQFADSQVNPDVASQEADLNNEKAVAETGASRLRDQLAEVYKRRGLEDPYAKQGIVSGAAQNFDANQEAQGTRQISEDLGNKLSYIAQRLTGVHSAAASKKASLTDSLSGQYAQQRYDLRRQQQQDQQAQNDRRLSITSLVGNPAVANLPDKILTQILQSAGYDVTP